MKIRTNDMVKVLGGKDNGKTGKVLQVFPKLGLVVVEGIRTTKKHLKGKKGQQGKIVDFPSPIAVSSVALMSKDGRIGRVGSITTKDGKKERVLKRAGETISL